jgi:hypothetical protein
LTEVAQDNGDNKEVVDEIVALSKKYGIISNYTSFLVTDPSEGHGTAINRPVPMRRDDVRMRSSRNGFGFAAGGGGGAGSFIGVTSSSVNGSFPRQVAKHGSMMAAMVPPPPAVALAMPQVSMGKSLRFAGDNMYSSSPREVQIIDDRPMGRDFRGAPASVVFEKKKSEAIADSGRKAVVNSKALSYLKNTDVVAMAKDEESSAIKSIEDKTFYLKNGAWVDSTYSEGSSPKALTVQFGSKEYFDLIHNTPGISKYLAIGREVTLVFKGHSYRVVSPPSA